VAVSLLYLILIRPQNTRRAVAAAIFAVHPVMVESWPGCASKRTRFPGVFLLGSDLCLLGFDESRSSTTAIHSPRTVPRWGLMTKTAIVTFAGSSVGELLVGGRGTLSWTRDVLPLAPFFRWPLPLAW